MFLPIFNKPPSAIRDQKNHHTAIQGAAPSPTNLDMPLHLVVPGDLGQWSNIAKQLWMVSRCFIWFGMMKLFILFFVGCVYVECCMYYIYNIYIYTYEDSRMESSILKKSGYFAVQFGQDLSMKPLDLCLRSTAKATKKQLFFWKG